MRSARDRARWRLTTLALLISAAAASSAQPRAVGEALGRPAVTVRGAERAVLLSASRADKRLVAVGERGIVVLSDDEGLSWRQAATPTSVTLTAVHFTDRDGWAVGHGGVVLASSDRGERWTVQLDGRRAAQTVLEAARSSNDPKALSEAQRLVAEGPDKPFMDIVVRGERKLLAVGAYGLALASEDGGKSWVSWVPRLPNPKGLHLYAARQRGDKLLLAGEQGLVLLSTDGGSSFRRIDTPYKGTFFAAEFLGDQDIVLAGLRGNALRSLDGGTTWAPIASPMPVSITASALDVDGRLVSANQAGFVMSLQADQLVPSNGKPLPAINGLLPLGGGKALALTVQGAKLVDMVPAGTR